MLVLPWFSPARALCMAGSVYLLGVYIARDDPEIIYFGWLLGWLELNGPLRQYLGLYRAVSQRKKREIIDKRKNVQTTPPASTASAVGPCPTLIQISRRPGTGILASNIAPSDHPLEIIYIYIYAFSTIWVSIEKKYQNVGSTAFLLLKAANRFH